MKLVSAHLQKFRNFDDSGEVPIQPDVTALVGKNESGKTAFLQGLHRLNPIEGKKFDELDHYPRWMYTRDRKGGSIPTVSPVQAVFEVEASDRSALASRFGPDVVVASKVTVARQYNDVVTVGQDVLPDEPKAVANLVARSQVPQHLAERFADLKTFKALEGVLAELERPPAEGSAPDPAIAPAVASVRAKVQALNIGEDFQGAVRSALRARVPQFFYFSDYDFIGGRTDLRRVYSTPPDQLQPPERTALSLLRLAGADNAAMLNEDYESRKAELEAVSNELTGEMTEYWSQSKDLEVVIDVAKETEQEPNGPTAVARCLEVRVKDRRHGHTDNIDKRSNGFRWFFSFLAAFSEYQGRDDRIIILLNEPALTLHARAQKDFLRFIDDRLAPRERHQPPR